MTFTRRLQTCHRCPERQRNCNGGCACLLDGIDITDHAQAGKCPAGRYDETQSPQIDASVRPAAHWGSEMWAELHRRALAFAGGTGDAETERVWLAAFASRVPCGECQGHWMAHVSRTPPDLSSSAAYFAWSVEAHNRVNARLGKPLMTVEEARAVWAMEFSAP